MDGLLKWSPLIDSICGPGEWLALADGTSAHRRLLDSVKFSIVNWVLLEQS